MRVLFIAFSCSPYGGSEDAVGWNTPLAMTRGGVDVTVITRTEQKPYIDRWHQENPGETMPRFKYVPVPRLLDAKLFRGQFQSLRLNPWLRRVHRYLVHMLREEDFEVIHQITPVEFRAVMKPVRHGGINVVGPLGGAGEPCKELRCYLGHGKAERIRLLVNRLIADSRRNARKLASYDMRYFANYETRDALIGRGASLDDPIVTDVGCAENEIERGVTSETRGGRRLRVLFVGRLVPRKGVRVLLEALEELSPDICSVRIYGDGTEREILELYVRKHGLSNVRFMGKLDHADIGETYRWADVLVFPSVRDTTGVVLVEALSHGVPVIAFDQYGAHVVLDGSCSLLVDPARGALGIANALKCCSKRQDALPTRLAAIKRCEALTWESKTRYFLFDYSQLLGSGCFAAPKASDKRYYS